MTTDNGSVLKMENWMFSPLEKTCLRWASQGKSVAEIALIIGKSVVDVENYLACALVSLDAGSIAEALSKINLSNSD